MRRSYKILLSILLLAIIIVAVNVWGPDFNEVKQQAYESVKYDVFDGQVINKYYDAKNHDFPTIILKNSYGEQAILLQLDNSRLFSFVEKNDSLSKEYGSYVVKVFRGEELYQFELDYGVNN